MYQILVVEDEGGGGSPRELPSAPDAPPSSPRGHRTIPINYNTILSTNVDNNSTGHSVPTEDITSQISTEQIISDDSPPPVPASPSPRRWTASMHEEIDKALVELEQYVDGLWLAYDPTEQKKYMHHILTARAYGELADKLRMTRLELAKNVALVSSKLKYLPWWVCAWPKAIYLRYRAVYNAAKTSRGVDTKPQWVYRL